MTMAKTQACIEAINEQSGGLKVVHVVAMSEMPDLLLAALGGDMEAGRIYRAACDAVAHIKSAPKRQPKLCATCNRHLRAVPYVLGIIVPVCDGPTQALALAICKHCAPGTESAQVKVMGALQRIWPDARELAITHPEGGRA